MAANNTWNWTPLTLSGGTNIQRSIGWDSSYLLNLYRLHDPVRKRDAIYPYAMYTKVKTFDVGTNDFKGRPGGAIEGDIYAFYVIGSIVFRVDAALTAINIGELDTTTGAVRMVLVNNYLTIVDGAWEYYYDLLTGIFTKNDDPDHEAPLNPTYACEQQGLALLNSRGTQKMFQAAEGQPFIFNLLNFILINYYSCYLSFPLVAFESVNARIVSLTTRFGEILINKGVAGFTFIPDENLTFGYGTINGTCVAKGTGGKRGDEEPEFLIFISQLSQGSFQFMMSTGSSPRTISTPSVEYRINNFKNPYDAVAFCFNENGQTFYQVSFTEDNVTMYYNVDADEWGDVDTFGNRHIAQAFTTFKNKKYFTSYADNCLYELSEKFTTQDGVAPLQLIVISVFMADGSNGSGGYRLIRGNKIRLYAQQGVGIAGVADLNSPNYDPSANPMVAFSASGNGGITYGEKQYSSLGRVADFDAVTDFDCPGTYRRWNFQLEFQSPPPFYLLGIQFSYDLLDGTQ